MYGLNRRQFLSYSALAIAAAITPVRFLQPSLAAQSVPSLDTSELPGIGALRWYAQQLTLLDLDDLEFKAYECEARESGSVPYKVNGAHVYLADELDLLIIKPDMGHEFFMADIDSHRALRYIKDVGLKGYLGINEDTITTAAAKIGNSRENSLWHGYGGYDLFRYRTLGKNERQNPTSQFKINGEPYPISEDTVLDGIAFYDTTRAPLLNGVYEGRHEELLRRRDQIFRETNEQYRKNLQLIIRELERAGKIRLQ